MEALLIICVPWLITLLSAYLAWRSERIVVSHVALWVTLAVTASVALNVHHVVVVDNYYQRKLPLAYRHLIHDDFLLLNALQFAPFFSCWFGVILGGLWSYTVVRGRQLSAVGQAMVDAAIGPKGTSTHATTAAALLLLVALWVGVFVAVLGVAFFFSTLFNLSTFWQMLEMNRSAYMFGVILMAGMIFDYVVLSE